MASPVFLYQIPLQPAQQQSLRVTLNGTEYRMRLTYCAAGEGCWILDIGDAGGVPILAGIPLLTGVNLLQQYDHLQIGGGGALFVFGAGSNADGPSFEDLGIGWQLYFAPPNAFNVPLSGVSNPPAGLLAATSAAVPLKTSAV